VLLCLLVGLGGGVLGVLILGLWRGWFRPRGAHANFDQGFSVTAIAQLAEAPLRTGVPQANRNRPEDDIRTKGGA
jgi:hypothetical protein